MKRNLMNELKEGIDALTERREWPKAGDKITFKGVSYFWFTNIIENAKTHLQVGETYTLSKIDIFSSWVKIQVEEVPNVDFALGFFEYES